MAVAELVVKLIGDVSGLSKTMKQVGSTIQGVGKSMQDTGKMLSIGVTAPILGIAAAALTMAGNFEASMSKVSALGEITGADLDRLKGQAIDLGAKTKYSAQEAADGMGELAAAGFKAEQIYQAMPGVLDLASSAQVSVGEAANIAATTLGQFNLSATDAGRVADVLAKSSAEGSLGVVDMAESLKYVGPVAYSAGQTLEGTAAAITVLSNAGIKGSQAGTSLAFGLTRIVKPTKEAQGVMDKYHLSLQTATGQAKPLTEIVQQLTDKHVSLADTARLVGANSLAAWLALQNKGAPALKDMTQKLIDAKGASAEMAKVLNDNLKGSFEQAKGAVETLGIKIGLALIPLMRSCLEVVQKLAEKMIGLVDWFTKLNPNIQNAIIAFTGVVAIAGPAILIIGKLTVMIGGFVKGLAVARTGVLLFTSATGLGAIVLVVGTLVALFVGTGGLNAAIGLFSDAMNSADFAPWIKAFSDVVGWIKDAIGWLVKFGQTLAGVTGESTQSKIQNAAGNAAVKAQGMIGDSVTGLFKAIKEAGSADDLKKVIGRFTEFRKIISESNLPVEQQTDAFKQLTAATQYAQVRMNELTGATKTVTAETKKEIPVVKESTEATDKKGKGKKKLTDEQKALEKQQKENLKQEKLEIKSAEDHAKEIDALVTGSDKYQEVLDKVKNKSITAAEGAGELKKIYIDGEKALNDYNTANDEYQALLVKYGSLGNVPAEQLGEVIEKLEIAKTKLGEFKEKKIEVDKTGFENLGKSIEDQLIGGVSDAAVSLLNGKSIRKQFGQLGASLGSTMGTAIGGALGGPIGAALGGAIGGSLGQKLGDAISDFGKSGQKTFKAISVAMLAVFPPAAFAGMVVNHFFGDKMFGDSEGTRIRKQIDKFFADAFDKNRIAIVINGQLSQLKDLDLGGGNFGTVKEGGFFQGLATDAQAAFLAIGQGFATMQGFGQDAAAGIGMALAENVGGSLNNLQVVVSGMGLSFEDMEKAVVNSMLGSEISFSAAQKALDGIKRISEKGIPDGIGYTIQAFQNLKEAGVTGGRYSTDALRDMGAEAKELGIKTIPALMQNLLASGKFTQKEIDQVFDALSISGITSIEALTDATDTQLLGALARLEDQGFPFADASADVKGFREEIDKIPDEKSIKFNVETDFDQNTETAIDAGYVPSNLGSRSSYTSPPVKRNAKGNVFSAGAAVPFAKGGVVSDFTMFDIGSMAERGPEAIMPLKRLSDGSLGVVSANSSSGGGNISIVVNAPYAQPGVAETIKREILKALDTKNNLPGIRR